MKMTNKFGIVVLAIVCFMESTASAQMSESTAKAWVKQGE